MAHPLRQQLEDAKADHAEKNAAYTKARESAKEANDAVRATCTPASDAANLVAALQAAVDKLPAE